jgi:glucosamine--fructose-6-phosphate aminotransferase (isomerizing)
MRDRHRGNEEIKMPSASYLYQEIHEQPQVLRTLLEVEQPTIGALAEEIRKRGVDYVLIAARGTSDNAGRYANYLFGALNGLPVALATPSLYTIYQRPPRLGNALVIGISQSGQSPDIVTVLADAKRQGALTAAITNSESSDLAQAVDFVIRLHAGVERSIAATKTYTAELMALAMLGATLAGEAELLDAIAEAPDAVAQVLGVNDLVAQAAQRYRYMDACVVVGRGYNYASAHELALKLKELTYTIAEPYSSADFMHGPLALVENGFPAIIFAPTGIMLPEMQEFIEVLLRRDAEPLVISDDAQTLARGRIQLPLTAHVPEWLSPLTAIVPGQLLALHLAAARGYDPDHPRGLRKITETR